MRIGWLIYGDLHLQTGGFFYDRQIIQGLRARGHRVEVVAWPWRSAFTAALGSLWGLDWRQVRGRRWDVVVEDGLVMPSLSLRPPRWPFPRVTLMHNPRAFTARPPWTVRWMARLEARYLQRVQGLIGVSRFNVRWARQHGFPGPATVAYPAGDHLRPNLTLTDLQARTHASGPLQVLFVGQLIPHKGLHVLLQALARLARHPWHLTIVGDLRSSPRYVKRLQGFVARHGLTHRVTWTGLLPHAQVAGHLRHSHVLAVPSRSEGYALVYIEAMGFGLPVIGSRVGGGPELIRHGENGFLVRPHPEDVADALVQCMDRARLARMARAARETFLQHPTWEDAVEVVEGFLLTHFPP